MVGYTKPTNKIVVAGNPLVQEQVVQTATNMIPGRLCKKGTAVNQVVVNTVGNTPLGWIGYEQTQAKYIDAHTIATAYSANDVIAVLNGGGFVIIGCMANGQNCTKGVLLGAAADGELTAAAAITATIPAGNTTVCTGTSSVPIVTVTGHYPPLGLVVGIAEELIDASGAACTGMVRSLI